MPNNKLLNLEIENFIKYEHRIFRNYYLEKSK